MSAEAAELLSEILVEGSCPPLTVLHYFNNMSGDGGGVAIAGLVRACPNLVDFRFSATRSKVGGCLAVAEVNLYFC